MGFLLEKGVVGGILAFTTGLTQALHFSSLWGIDPFVVLERVVVAIDDPSEFTELGLFLALDWAFVCWNFTI